MSELLLQSRLTEEAIADMRGRIGIPLRTRITWNTSSCYDSVRHYCIGIGDDNPLWIDRAYGKTTALGQVLAPPSYPYSCNPTFVQMGLKGVHGFHARSDWRWYRPIRQGEELGSMIWLDAIDEWPSKMGGRSLATWYSSVVFNDRNEVLSRARSLSLRMERGAARERKKELLEPATWTPEQLRELEEAYLREQPRGAEPRYWEDVNEGDAIEPRIKGPLCMSDMMAYYAGNMVAPTPAHRLAVKDYARHPAWYFRNPENFGLEPIIRVHENIAAARSAGVPAPYDVGIQRHAWMVQSITDWMGDDAFLESNQLEYRAFNYFGDVQTFTGEVTRKYVGEDGLHRVELQVRGTSQRGTVTVPGVAIVVLPTRGGEAPVKVFDRQVLKLEDYLATHPSPPDLSRATERQA